MCEEVAEEAGGVLVVLGYYTLDTRAENAGGEGDAEVNDVLVVC